MKLFELPIYAISSDTLKQKYQEFKRKFQKTYSTHKSVDDVYKKCLDIETYPQRLWDYNHIVGYIRISLTQNDVLFDIFLPTPKIERYLWRSHKKHFLYNIYANGTHFYIGCMNNEEIRTMAENMLDGVIKDHIPPRYYVDRESFDYLNNQIDYRTLLEVKHNGQAENAQHQ
ncbi:MAG TPA: hypothetical protein DEP23_14345 [Ruminococcaceae bacterium]|nr:hypothetical protein [Oscillospiraceae bacterium]